MKEIQYEIVKEIAVLSASDSGYTKEINLISWNGREPKYDIRSFSPNREKCGKGITLNADEAAALLEALQKEVNSGVDSDSEANGNGVDHVLDRIDKGQGGHGLLADLCHEEAVHNVV